MPSYTVVGLQWGDEGKGKVIDLLSEKAHLVARAQGGNNAGHTIVVGTTEYRFHLVPSGILYPQTRCLIGGGTVVDPKSLLSEIDSLVDQGVVIGERLLLSPYAHLVLPYHKWLDEEAEKGKGSVGTTKRGIGPCYADKAARLGIRVADLMSPTVFRKRLEMNFLDKNPPFEMVDVEKEYLRFAERLARFVGPVEELLYEGKKKGANILFEGAQGTLLDTTYGTYPFVTSSSTLAGGIATGLGIGPSAVGTVLGVVKAYTTRVGGGPLPTELNEEDRPLFPDNVTSREIGATTGRLRRMGWLDAVALSHAVKLNGADTLALMKLDILDEIKEIKICVAYQIGSKRFERFPVLAEDLAEAKPIYETMPGWRESTRGCSVYKDLPQAAKAYIRKVEALAGVPVGLVSVGPERDRTLFLDRYFE